MGWRLLSLQHVYSVDVTPRKTCCTSALLAAPKNERASHKTIVEVSVRLKALFTNTSVSQQQ